MLIQAIWRLPGQVVIFILKHLDANFARCFLKLFLTRTDKLAAAVSNESNIKEIKDLVEQGRTDAWIAHKLGISGTQLVEHKVELGLVEAPEVDDAGTGTAEEQPEPEADPGAKDKDDAEQKAGTEYEGALEHGEKDGYGLWFDPAVQDDSVYKGKWADVKSVKVSFESDKIIIRPLSK